MTSWSNDKLVKWQKQWNNKFMNCQFDDITIWWNDKLIKPQVIKTSSLWNDKLLKHTLIIHHTNVTASLKTIIILKLLGTEMTIYQFLLLASRHWEAKVKK